MVPLVAVVVVVVETFCMAVVVVVIVMVMVSQTSFGHISINSPSILTVSMATESP